jgi:hypothetical protein
MPTMDEFFAQIQAINTNLTDNFGNKLLQTATTDLGQIEKDVEPLHKDFGNVEDLQKQTLNTLLHISQQNDAIICILEHISRNTCTLVNLNTLELAAQEQMKEDTNSLLQISETSHPDAALVLERQKALKRQIEECCPPKVFPPACVYEPCPAPKPLVEIPTPKPPQ